MNETLIIGLLRENRGIEQEKKSQGRKTNRPKPERIVIAAVEDPNPGSSVIQATKKAAGKKKNRGEKRKSLEVCVACEKAVGDLISCALCDRQYCIECSGLAESGKKNNEIIELFCTYFVGILLNI